MGKMIRGITKNKNARFFVVDSKDIVKKAQEIHVCSAAAIIAFGRLLTAGVLMGFDLKNEDHKISIKLEVDGPIKGVIVTANNKGEIKGFINNNIAQLPDGNIDKANVNIPGIVGKGSIVVIKDMGLKKPYVGISEIVSGEIGQDLAYYYFNSEQVKSVVGLGVFVNKDLSIKEAGGFIIQLLPDATEEFVDKLEKRINSITSITEMIEKGMDVADIAKSLFEGVDEVEILDEIETAYKCDCNKDRFFKGVITIGEKELKDIFSKNDKLETECHFCNKKYSFKKEEFKEYIGE